MSDSKSGGSGRTGRGTATAAYIDLSPNPAYRGPVLSSYLAEELETVAGQYYDTGDAALAVSRAYNYKDDWDELRRANEAWVNGADSTSKDRIYGLLSNQYGEARTLSLFDFYQSALRQKKTGQTFMGWLNTPQTFYRAGGISQPFMSFSTNEAFARRDSGFGQTGQINRVRLAPSELLGTAQNGGTEVYIEPDAVGL